MNNQFRKFRLCQTWNPSNRLLFFFIFCYFQSMASYSISLNLTNLIVIWSQNINWLGKKDRLLWRAHTHTKTERERDEGKQIYKTIIWYIQWHYFKSDWKLMWRQLSSSQWNFKKVSPNQNISQKKKIVSKIHTWIPYDSGQFLSANYICLESNQKSINNRWMSKMHALIVLSQHKKFNSTIEMICFGVYFIHCQIYGW